MKMSGVFSSAPSHLLKYGVALKSFSRLIECIENVAVWNWSNGVSNSVCS